MLRAACCTYSPLLRRRRPPPSPLLLPRAGPLLPHPPPRRRPRPARPPRRPPLSPPPFAPSNNALSSCSTACIKAIDASGGVSGNAISRTACIACGDSGTCPTLPSGCVNVGVLTGCYEKGQSVNGVVFCDDSLPSGAGAGVITLCCVVFLALVASGLVMMRRRRSFQSTGFGGGARGYAVIPVSLEARGVAMQPTVGGGFNQ